MLITELIEKDLPEFTGLCVMETTGGLAEIRAAGISLAWKFNIHRARTFKKILVAGGRDDRGKYFIADIDEIATTLQITGRPEWASALNYHEENFGNWITDRLNGVIKDNILSERHAILFKNPTPIKSFSTNDFQFNSNPVYYKIGNPQAGAESLLRSGERISIKNVGKILSADITLNGLTVIAGANDTGKSTIGKFLFSIVKAISRYEQDLNEGKEKIVLEKIEKLFFRLRRIPEYELGEQFRSEFYPKTFLNQIKIYFDSNQGSIWGDNDGSYLDKVFENKESFILNLPKERQKDFLKDLKEIKESLIYNEDKKEQKKRALSRVLFSEFQSEVSPKTNTDQSEINYTVGSSDILKIKLRKNTITEFETFDELVFRDVIYIETPLLLQMYDLIQSASTLFAEDDEDDRHFSSRLRPKVSLHVKDLIAKIDNAKYYASGLFESNFVHFETLKRISDIINGGFIFDAEKRNFSFSQRHNKKGSVDIKPINIASGIKSFGLIQLLLQANTLNDTSLLIIDEPENHLHPEWQVKYASMIIELIKKDIFIIINSHSPYMIQALRYFGEKAEVSEKISYHYAELNSNESQSVIKDVSNDLNIIFSKLAAPLKELVWQ